MIESDPTRPEPDGTRSVHPANVPPPPRNPLRRSDRVAQAIAEASVRRQAAIAAYQAARESAGE
ncbi:MULTISPECIES: hypothetical protein [Micromonospora]|uniref:Uncharacterized protein n=1 Tax=Micromonospora rifamycinica TaxID=291594 RepID=A0A109IMI6_9ACTN|nr:MULTISPECIES: hypothetical protein [Micromonospora]KWV33308.1 hypothetical protein AWV63_07540 [Micromonospora rifamycinica]WFE93557.1 hypothetical protein O7612_19300 [Micromonospora sp. WMMD987]SCG81577.1 hypothetical protein GA0070623_5961 [Micromonospora rifamycinica]